MTALVRLRPPAWIGQTLRYATRPRAKRAFRTVLDAADLLAHGATTEVHLESDEDGVRLHAAVDLREGRMVDVMHHDADLALRRLERRVSTRDGGPSRSETIDFGAATHPLPSSLYVDVGAPFLLGGEPFDGKSRSIYVLICDRFVAKVYFESRGKHTLTVPAGRFETIEVVMYPDLNDWVPLPSVITKLSKPFIPKYHMWYEARAPHRLVQFEGPHGPPGAPEIVLELVSMG